jgi:hypothetical protein
MRPDADGRGLMKKAIVGGVAAVAFALGVAPAALADEPPPPEPPPCIPLLGGCWPLVQLAPGQAPAITMPAPVPPPAPEVTP